ncbi:MAG: AraC family transcriptional regulator [Bacteroidota bacterium]
MNRSVKTYDTRSFRENFLNLNSDVSKFFERGDQDFFCLRIEDIVSHAKVPVPPSREKCHTLILVQEGYYDLKLGTQEYRVENGDLIIQQAGAIFSIDRINRETKGFTCHFHPDTLIGKSGNPAILADFAFLNIWADSLVRFDENRLPFVTTLFRRLQLEYTRSQKPDFAIIHAYLLALLSEIKALTDADAKESKNAAHYLVQRFKKSIHTRVKDNLSVRDFAAQLNVSPNHLNKCTKQITGYSASRLIDDTKIMEAKYLLYQTNLTVSEIANELGFLDPSYFSRFFKKSAGVTPVEYRKMIEKS